MEEQKCDQPKVEIKSVCLPRRNPVSEEKIVFNEYRVERPERTPEIYNWSDCM